MAPLEASRPSLVALHGLAGSLAAPVARGYLPENRAYAALTLAAQRLADTLGVDMPSLLQPAWTTFLGWSASYGKRRRQFLLELDCLLRPLVSARTQRNRLLAEAHGLNGQRGFPFAEDEILGLVVAVCAEALPRPEWSGAGRPRHAR